MSSPFVAIKLSPAKCVKPLVSSQLSLTLCRPRTCRDIFFINRVSRYKTACVFADPAFMHLRRTVCCPELPFCSCGSSLLRVVLSSTGYAADISWRQRTSESWRMLSVSVLCQCVKYTNQYSGLMRSKPIYCIRIFYIFFSFVNRF